MGAGHRGSGAGGPGGPEPPRRRTCGAMDVHHRLLIESAEYRAARADIESATLERMALAPEARFGRRDAHISLQRTAIGRVVGIELEQLQRLPRLFVVLFLYVFTAVAQAAANEAFPRPEELQRDIAFWKRIYTEVTTSGGLLHDPERLDVVILAERVEERRVVELVEPLEDADRDLRHSQGISAGSQPAQPWPVRRGHAGSAERNRSRCTLAARRGHDRRRQHGQLGDRRPGPQHTGDHDDRRRQLRGEMVRHAAHERCGLLGAEAAALDRRHDDDRLGRVVDVARVPRLVGVGGALRGARRARGRVSGVR